MSKLIFDGMCMCDKVGSVDLKIVVIVLVKFFEMMGKFEKICVVILKVVVQVLWDKGYKVVMMRCVVVEVDMQVGSVYYYFKFKDVIVDEVLNVGLRDLFLGVNVIVEEFEKLFNYCFRVVIVIWMYLYFFFLVSEFMFVNIRSYGMLFKEL